jgi:hypothetical protein
LYSPENIHETAKKFKKHEKKHGPYSFGDSFTKARCRRQRVGPTRRAQSNTSGRSPIRAILHIGPHILCPNTSLK